MQPPDLFDRAAISARRRRTKRDALFLHDHAITEINERLIEVNRTFTDVAIVTGHPQPWSEAFAGARLVPDDDTLDLTPGAHNLVIHAMALHLAVDPVGQLVQCRRALRPDGLLLAVTPGGQTLHQLRSCLSQAEVEITGGLSPRVAPMGEIRDLGALLQRAGMALPVADSLPLTVDYESPLHLMRELRAMGEANPMAQRLRHFTRRAILIRAAEIYATFADSVGRIPATFELIFLTGWCPHPSQPAPLRPGSATSRLADALGTREENPETPPAAISDMKANP